MDGGRVEVERERERETGCQARKDTGVQVLMAAGRGVLGSVIGHEPGCWEALVGLSKRWLQLWRGLGCWLWLREAADGSVREVPAAGPAARVLRGWAVKCHRRGRWRGWWDGGR